MAFDLMESRRRILMNTPHLVEASGDIATFSTDMAVPLKSCVVTINPVQSGSGDPSPDNIRPISGWSAVNAWRTGKNLLDPSYKTISVNNIRFYQNKRIALPPGIYTMSGEQQFNGLYVSKDGGTIFAKYSSSFMTFELTELTPVSFNFYKNSGINSNQNCQLELSSTPTAYAPYSGNQYTIQLGQTVYGGTLDVTNGVLTVDRAIHTFNGGPNEGWTATGSTYYSSDITDYSKQSQSKLISNQYKSFGLIPGRSALTADCTFGLYSGDQPRLYIRDDKYEDVAALKAGLSTTNLVVCYELATHVAYPLSDIEVTTLRGQNNIWADCGPVDIKYWKH